MLSFNERDLLPLSTHALTFPQQHGDKEYRLDINYQFTTYWLCDLEQLTSVSSRVKWG